MINGRAVSPILTVTNAAAVYPEPNQEDEMTAWFPSSNFVLDTCDVNIKQPYQRKHINWRQAESHTPQYTPNSTPRTLCATPWTPRERIPKSTIPDLTLITMRGHAHSHNDSENIQWFAHPRKSHYNQYTQLKQYPVKITLKLNGVIVSKAIIKFEKISFRTIWPIIKINFFSEPSTVKSKYTKNQIYFRTI